MTTVSILIEAWEDCRAGLDRKGEEKSLVLRPVFEPQTVQKVRVDRHIYV
jgi:hypothetical protein